MTTVVTVKTGHCPAVVRTSGYSSYNDEKSSISSNYHNTYFLDAESQRDFTISSDCHFSVGELPEGMTGLQNDKACAQGHVCAETSLI